MTGDNDIDIAWKAPGASETWTFALARAVRLPVRTGEPSALLSFPRGSEVTCSRRREWKIQFRWGIIQDFWLETWVHFLKTMNGGMGFYGSKVQGSAVILYCPTLYSLLECAEQTAVHSTCDKLAIVYCLDSVSLSRVCGLQTDTSMNLSCFPVKYPPIRGFITCSLFFLSVPHVCCQHLRSPLCISGFRYWWGMCSISTLLRCAATAAFRTATSLSETPLCPGTQLNTIVSFSLYAVITALISWFPTMFLVGLPESKVATTLVEPVKTMNLCILFRVMCSTAIKCHVLLLKKYSYFCLTSLWCPNVSHMQHTPW